LRTRAEKTQPPSPTARFDKMKVLSASSNDITNSKQD
jgi:hypothetical protein